MLKLYPEPSVGTIARIQSALGERWYCLCGNCGDMREIAKPANPDYAQALCDTCYDDAHAVRKDCETADYRRAMGV